MKKITRTLICLILIVCLLLLPGCKRGAAPDTGETENSTALPSLFQESTENQQKQDELDLHWEPAFLRFRGFDLWEEDTPQVAKLLTYESCKALVESCLSLHGTCDKYCFMYSPEEGLCDYAKRVKSISYPKEFFEENSLVLVGLSSGSGSTIFDVSNLYYAHGVLTCTIDIPFTRETFGTADMASWLCFIAVDTVLPEGTEIKTDIGAVEMDMEAYMQKYHAFRANSI